MGVPKHHSSEVSERKKRSCMQDNCSFVGSYNDLRKHVRASHPLARPREVDASLVEKWKKLENDSELNDVISTQFIQQCQAQL